MTKKCTCGASEPCTYVYKVSLGGAISVDAKGLINCGKVKRDMRKTHEAVFGTKKGRHD